VANTEATTAQEENLLVKRRHFRHTQKQQKKARNQYCLEGMQQKQGRLLSDVIGCHDRSEIQCHLRALCLQLLLRATLRRHQHHSLRNKRDLPRY
jgi:hypothetical protein